MIRINMSSSRFTLCSFTTGVVMGSSKIVFIVICIIFCKTILAGRNKLIFERYVCPKPSPDSVAQSLRCITKRINRTNLKIDLSFNLTKPLKEFWVHVVVYYKFNGLTFSKFPVDLMEDLCGWLNGTARSIIADVALSQLLKYSNLNHTCPINAGFLWIKVDSIPEDAFKFELSLIPSGKYRLELEYMESFASAPFMKGIMYFSVSDYRLAIV